MTKALFNEAHLLHELKHYLPTQTPLKDFIHHNSLHAFQSRKFYDAIFKSSKIFGFQVTMSLSDFRKLYETGRIRPEILETCISNRKPSDSKDAWNRKLLFEQYNDHVDHRIGKLRSQWRERYHVDLDNLVQPFLFRFLCSYLDQGISIWNFPIGNLGFLASIRELEKNSFSSIFQTKRARELLKMDGLSMHELLKIVVGNEAYFEQYIFDQQFSHRGWSGMVSAVESNPDTLLSPKNISLNDLIIFELLLEIDRLDGQLGKDWKPISDGVPFQPIDLFQEVENTELHDVLKIWQDAFEWSYYDEFLAGIQQLSKSRRIKETNVPIAPKSFQALFCIDEREDSIRRHVESNDRDSETFGTPGFFSVEFYFQAFGAKFYDKLCPAPVTPKYLIKEYDVTEKRKHDLLYTNKTHQLVSGFLSAFVFGFWSAFRLMKNLLFPVKSPAISNAFLHMNAKGKLTVENKDVIDTENNLQIGFTVDEMSTRVASLLRGIALTKDFAPIVYVVAHGSSSANNPHHGAHDCGACSGRPGSVNARVFALMANNPKVREVLKGQGIYRCVA
jgi:uncharacterized protein